MSAEFSMKCKWDNSNLYIKTAGDFTQGAAETLSAVLLTQQNSVCRIFVDTVKLDMDASAAAQYFRTALMQGGMGSVAGGKLFFKGKQGFALAIDGCRVLLTKKKACQCKTPCARCLCAERSQQRREGEGGHDHDHGHCHCHHGGHADHEHAHAHKHAHEHDHEHSHGQCCHGHEHDHEHHHEHDSGRQPVQLAHG